MGVRIVKVQVVRANNQLRITVDPAVITLGTKTNDTCRWVLTGGVAQDSIDVRPKDDNKWPVTNMRPHGPGNGQADSGAITANADPTVVYPYEIGIKTAVGREYLIDPDMIIDDDGSGGGDPDDEDGDDGDGNDEEK